VLDHVSLGVSDIDRSRRFYDTALSPLGLVRIVDFGNGRGSDYGAAPGSLGVEFTITRERVVRGPTPGGHVCFRAPTRAAVRDFHAAAFARRRAGRWRAGTSAQISRRLLCRFRARSRRPPDRGSVPRPTRASRARGWIAASKLHHLRKSLVRHPTS